MTALLRSRRAAYAALAILTLVWSSNWIAMKLALENSDPVSFNLQRTWLAVAVLFAVLVLQRRGLRPSSWLAVLVTGLFQTTINFGSTTMALAGGAPGRTAVLVFTMPFWTLLLAWPVLAERVRGSQWLAIAFALVGLVLLVAPWDWHGDLAPRLWAVLSGFGWAAGTVATKYFQRNQSVDMLNFLAWQMLLGVLPLTALALVLDLPSTRWSATQVLLLIQVGVVATALGFILWIEVLRFLPAGTASLNMFAIPVIALLLSMAIFDERLAPGEWAGIACIAAGLLIVSWRALRAARSGAPSLPDPTPAEGG
jgi:drug/metabolite transporter (DMT)-like permease